MEMTKPKEYTQTATCLECGKEFTVHRKWQKFDHPDCRMAHFIRSKQYQRSRDDAEAEAQRQLEKKRLEERQVEKTAQSGTIQKAQKANKSRRRGAHHATKERAN
jgi:hypothetical protein